MVDVFATAWEPAQVEALETLRAWAVAFAELNQHMSTWMGLPTSDANALGQIVWAAEEDAPLTPARLGQRIGMTSGATTVLLNRLEQAGLIVRSREHQDRRRVTLRPTDEAREQNRAFSEVASQEVAHTLLEASSHELEASITFVRRMTVAASQANTRLNTLVASRQQEGPSTQ